MTRPDPTEARDHLTAWRAQVEQNSFEVDAHLQSLLTHYGREGLSERLHPFGALCATELDALIRENNRDENLPRLARYDDLGNRVEAVDFHPTYHAIGRLLYGTGLMALYGTPGHELESLAYLYLFAQNGEGGHACPCACTAGLIKILQADEGDHAEWLGKLLTPDYDHHFHGSQFLTEVQGGSDVGSNAAVARSAGDGTWRITGEKWFCSVIDADLFLLTARPEGAPDGTRGLQAYAVPRRLSDGTVNAFAVRRLKYKLGTRSMASAEVDFDGAFAVPVGDFHDVVVIVLNTSRLYNAVCSAGMMQRVWMESNAYARAREAFGKPILGFPNVARILARLRTEAYAARGLTFFLADLSDRIATGRATVTETGAWRMLVNLNKYWTSHIGTSCVRDGIEVLGGNGTIEEFTVLPRLLRDSIVCEAWEGSHNVLCAQVLRDSRRFGLHRAMFAVLEDLSGGHARLTRAAERWEALLAGPEACAEGLIRDVVDELRPVAQALVLHAESRRGGSDPLLPVVIEHLLEITRPDYDPMADQGLMERVSVLAD
ncbi:MAG: acyl-CoA dehydrogenase family protein [Deltaproteobacteria bacterium]|nr:acyl-CoA dehydrogenase family protein [Deltaproteobacteria bacterium]